MPKLESAIFVNILLRHAILFSYLFFPWVCFKSNTIVKGGNFPGPLKTKTGVFLLLLRVESYVKMYVSNYPLKDTGTLPISQSRYVHDISLPFSDKQFKTSIYV